MNKPNYIIIYDIYTFMAPIYITISVMKLFKFKEITKY